MIEELAEPETRQRFIVLIGLAGIGLACAAAEVVVTRTSFDTWGGILIAILLFLITLPFLASAASSEKHHRILPLLVLALTAKLLGGFVYYFVFVEFFGGIADASSYHRAGAATAELFRAGDIMGGVVEAGSYPGTRTFVGLSSLMGTRFIVLVTGVMYTLIGTSYLGGFVFFSWLAFLGTFFFYRAFSLTFPGNHNRTYLLLLFFLPSMLFWSSTIGKEAWMMFSLGLAAFGAARLLESRSVTGAATLALGIIMMAAVRIHVAAMVGAAVVTAYIFLRQNKALRELAPVAKGLTLTLLVAGLSLVALRGQQYLVSAGLDPEAGLTAALVEVSERTSEAGSDFEPAVVKSPLQLPMAIWTVLFRPHPLEIRDTFGGFAALESLFLLAYIVFRFGRVVAAAKSVREKPYVTVALTFTLLFVVAFSSYANFGLLLRQRIQVLPFLLLVASFPNTKPHQEQVSRVKSPPTFRR